MDLLVAFFTDSGPVIVAGMFGGAMRWALFRPKLADGLINIFVGGTLAFYMSPFAVPLLAPALSGLTADIPNIHRFCSFVIGLGGVAAVGWLFDKFWKKKPEPLPPVPSPPPASGE